MEFEENENSWFSLWTEVHDERCNLILFNKGLADDPIFNHATSVRCLPEEADDLIERTVSKFKEKNIPPCFYVSPLTSPKNFSKRLEDNGFIEWDRLIVMEFVRGETRLSKPKLDTRIASDIKSMNVWINVFKESFNIGISQTQAYMSRVRHIFSRSDTNFFLAYIDHKAIGCVALHSKNGVGGLYSLGIIPQYRRRGVATGILSTLTKYSESRHNNSLILQSLQQDRLEEFYCKNGFNKTFLKRIYLLQ